MTSWSCGKYMQRDIEKELLFWKNQAQHLPILLRGARQVGKSYVVEKFGRDHFDNMLLVNFELQPELCACFDALDPYEILKQLSLLQRQKIEPGKTLLFLDEIQDCPNAIRALRYFKEKLPELHVIGAGSLLEFTLNDANFRMPVGRVQSLYLKPLSFKEYLSALNYQDLRELIEVADLKKPIAEPIHQLLLKQIRNYMVLGGMPGVLKSDLALQISNEYRLQQASLLSSYRQDFGKYAKHTQIKYLQQVFEKAPGLVGDHFKYSKVDPEVRSQYTKAALELLQHAGLIYPVYSTAASGIPLINLMNEKKFKILFLDVGLMTYASRIEAELLLEDVILVNRGAIAEQFVGQELLAAMPYYEEAKLFFWCREKKSSMAEVDFIITVGAKIIPIEVKAGSTGKLKSLHLLMDEKNMKLGVRVSQQALSFDGKILSVPIYMSSEVSRLIKKLF
jgi:predicted AAA+ superfamily ATPase